MTKGRQENACAPPSVASWPRWNSPGGMAIDTQNTRTPIGGPTGIGRCEGSPCFVVCPFRARRRRHGLPERKRNGQDRSRAGLRRHDRTNTLSRKRRHGRDNVSAVSSSASRSRPQEALSAASQHRDARHAIPAPPPVRVPAAKKKRAPARPGRNDSSGQDLNTSRRGRVRPCPASGEATGQDVRTATSLAGERRNTNPVRPGLACRLAFRGRMEPPGPGLRPVLRCLFFLSRARTRVARAASAPIARSFAPRPGRPPHHGARTWHGSRLERTRVTPLWRVMRAGSLRPCAHRVARVESYMSSRTCRGPVERARRVPRIGMGARCAVLSIRLRLAVRVAMR